MSHIRLAIHDTKRIPAARGFYDVMENSLNFVIKARGKFYSYVQGEDYSIDLDKKGNVLGVELYLERDAWVVVPELLLDNDHEIKRIRILEHRLDVEPVGIYTNEAKDVCCIRFTDEKVSYKYMVAQNLLFEVNVVDELSAVWLLNLEEDFGFKKEMKYRKGKKAT